jgi:hypothetical protein
MHSVGSFLRTAIQSEVKAAHTQGEKEQGEKTDTVDEHKGPEKPTAVKSRACSEQPFIR